jgi:chorismate mutase
MNIVDLKDWGLGLNSSPLLITGPCSAETENQVFDTALELKQRNLVHLFRAGVWKPRTRPNCFEGMGEKALPWLARVSKELNIPTCIEVAKADHVEKALKSGVSCLWIGARTTAGPFAVQEMAEALKGVDIPVMVKNPICADISLWIGALERFSKAGVTKLLAIHRGFPSTVDSRFRNAPNWKIPIELKILYPKLPIICDPSHIAGKRELIGGLIQQAIDYDFNGIMVESHVCPDLALSDKRQQLRPAQLEQILKSICTKSEYSGDRKFKLELDELREKIDHIDYELLEVLRLRMETVRIIGKAKKEKRITPLQKNRIEFLLKERVQKAETLGLSKDFVKEIFSQIHTESLKSQTEIIH